jgi:tRNA U34 2-thiouridine synthase MnmA/TrmU
MYREKNQHRALALFSGGLDSLLAVKIIQSLGIDVIPVCFVSPFFNATKTRQSADVLNLTLQIQPVDDDYLKIVESPRFGYGKHLNPCIDCHAYMLKKLGQLMPKFQADFMISGEVLGQRPKSQAFTGLNTVAKHSGYKDLIVRPLSQKLLPDTLPIREGWVDKDKLYDIQGRSRTRQIELAKKFGITNYPSPAGGCLLTDKGYCKRLQDLIDHQMFSWDFIKFLDVGRHFRISNNVKLILGRNKIDNERLQELAKDKFITLHAKDFAGPFGVINYKKEISIAELRLSAQILLRYIKKVRDKGKVEINIGSKSQTIEVEKMKPGVEKEYLIN